MEEKEFLEEALNLSKDFGVNVDAVLMASRRVSRAIIEIIQRDRPDLLILHWKGYIKMTEGKQIIFGTNLDKILREANCDLIVARINNSNDLKNILIPFVAGPSMQLTEEIATMIAESQGGKLHLILISSSKDPQISAILSKVNIPAHIPLKSEVLPIEDSSCRSIAYQIVQKSQDFGCILMASAKSRLFREMIFGNIAEMVARNSSRSLILVKSHRVIIGSLISYLRSKIYSKRG